MPCERVALMRLHGNGKQKEHNQLRSYTNQAQPTAGTEPSPHAQIQPKRGQLWRQSISTVFGEEEGWCRQGELAKRQRFWRRPRGLLYLVSTETPSPLVPPDSVRNKDGVAVIRTQKPKSMTNCKSLIWTFYKKKTQKIEKRVNTTHRSKDTTGRPSWLLGANVTIQPSSTPSHNTFKSASPFLVLFMISSMRCVNTRGY